MVIFSSCMFFYKCYNKFVLYFHRDVSISVCKLKFFFLRQTRKKVDNLVPNVKNILIRF